VIELRVPGELSYRDIAMRVVSAACKLVPKEVCPTKDEIDFTHQVISAFGEAFNNAVLHGYGDTDQPGWVEIHVFVEAERLVIKVHDQGQSFDPDSVPLPDLEGLPESGMGLFIMRQFMDEVLYHAGETNVLTLVKYYKKNGLPCFTLAT
jgi:serine/threonine-protein kinase RsbW